MKRILTLIAAAGITFFMASCGDDEGTVPPVVTEPETLVGNITEDKTLTSDIIWELEGRVFVTGGATLTIEPGTIIKGKPGTGSNASVLTIARDGKINAAGTAAKPIIFTATSDNIKLGELKGSNLEATDNQQWGGIVILGSAPVSPKTGTEAQIEGVPGTEALGLYGGDKPADDQGKLSYVSIRHGGTTIDPSTGNDINGLTLGGVGSGTIIENIEIIANFDDGVEFFGGTVNVKNLLVYGVGDDAIDIDQAYAGTIDNFWAFTTKGADSDEGLEIDGPEGSENETGKFTIKNGTVVGVDGEGSAAEFKSKAQGNVMNVKWSGFTGGAKVKVTAKFDKDNECAQQVDAYYNLIDGSLVFATVELGSISVTNAESDSPCEVPAEYQTAVEGEVTSETATGASDASIWNTWSLADGLGLL